MVGQTISHYKITEKLGEGGMGVVYKAEDTKLERPVALKFLASNAIEDPEHKARFVREAKAAARLDHQNICPVYEIDEADGQTFLAMAYLEGQTVKEKIAERPLKLDEALDIAIQTAQGLKVAHRKEIVHRDIKPANLMLTAEGQVKIMDFGLAQLAEQSRLTKSAMLLGTPVYMSPEQAQKTATDRRTDIWSLGVVIYEMVTSKLPFERERLEGVLYAIGNEAPEPITALRAGLPMELEWIVGKAMAKDADERYQHVDEMIVDLKSLSKKLASGKSTILHPRPGPAPSQSRLEKPVLGKPLLPWAVAVVSVLFALTFAFVHFRETPRQEAPLRRFAFTPESLYPEAQNVAISPNGRHIAYVAGGEQGKLWVRDLDREQPRAMEGTEGAARPFWSADSAFIGFAARGELKKISIQGGPAAALCPVQRSRYWGGAWSPDSNSIVFSSGITQQLREVPSIGGTGRLLFEPEKTEKGSGNMHPQFLPPGSAARSLVFSVGSSELDVVVKNLETGQSEVLAAGALPVYSPSGHIIYQTSLAEGGLWALPFSIKTLRPTGVAFPIVESGANPSVAGDGTLTYVDYAASGQQGLVWWDRGGKKLGSIGQPQENILFPALAPDGQRVAVRGTEGRGREIWVHEAGTALKTRVTFDPALDADPIWSPSGKEITFFSLREGNGDVFSRPADGTGEAVKLVGSPLSERALDWSADGKYLLYGVSDSDLWYLKRNEDGSGFESVPYLQTPFRELTAKFSLDGRYVAYCSDESGRNEIYVRTFPEQGGKWQVSGNGGTQPRWSRDANELFYVERDTLMAVAVTTTPSFSKGSTTRLFQDGSLVTGAPWQRSYDASADGQRFVLVERLEAEAGAAPAIHVVENWYEEFRDHEQD